MSDLPVAVHDVTVAVPWGDPDPAPDRQAALGWMARRWVERCGTEVTIGWGFTDDNQWCKALGVANALDADPNPILVISDADVWCDGVVEAIQRVRDGAPWVIPHHKVHRLNFDATIDVLHGREPTVGMALDPIAEGLPGIAYAGVMGGGIVVCRRDVYETCPLDPRFVGWGQEDEAWGLALRCLYGPPVRLSAPLWHLWHPPQPRLNRGTGSEAGLALYRRYAKAKRRPEQMRALIDEGRVLC